MAIRNNRIVVDLNKVQYGILYYRNQYGQLSPHKYNVDTVRRCAVSSKEYAAYHPDYPGETMLERAKRLDILDRWTPELHLKLQANSYLIYTGEKALSIWKAWQARQFGTKKD